MRYEIKRRLFLFLFLFVFLSFCSLAFFHLRAFAGIKGTKHDLSVSGAGTVKALTETQTCIFCHTPHNAEPAYPLWGHEVTSFTNYTHYTSASLVSYTSEADAPPIDGISRLCLSCHDGTIALGAITAGHEQIVMTSKFMPSDSPGYLGTDLSGGHPISIVYDEDLVSRRAQLYPNLMQLKWPISDLDVKLYPTQQGYGVQCASCHDPHGGKGSPEAPPFWQKAEYEDVCLVCHDIASSIGH
jgi:predicted CXXCH cytochrome family protein